MQGYFYRAEKLGIAGAPVGEGHEMEWHSPRDAEGLLKLEHQRWAVREWSTRGI